MGIALEHALFPGCAMMGPANRKSRPARQQSNLLLIFFIVSAVLNDKKIKE
jgi:hypothetical protein